MDQYYSLNQTKSIAKAVLSNSTPSFSEATVIALKGDLGAGKTTLVQSIGTLLGIVEPMVSPTFVVARFYPTTSTQWNTLVHIDAYRIEHSDELKFLGFETMIKTPQTLVIIEWPEHIESAIPQSATWYAIDHHDEMRRIKPL